MPSGQVHWTLVFTAASLDHLAERNVEVADVVDAVYGRHGPARVRRTGRGARERWFIVAPLEDGDIAIRPPRTEQIAVRLYKDDVKALRSLAAAHGVGHTTLARTVLEGWLARSRGKGGVARRRQARRPA